MKFYDQYGLPDDGKDHSRFIIEDSNEIEGRLDFQIGATYDVAPRLAPDIDYKVKDMTKD